MNSVITGKVTKTVTLGVGGYTSPLTISETGSIVSTGSGADGVYVPKSATNADIINDGFIEAGDSSNSPENGGVGISLLKGTQTFSATITNGDIIEGGRGGYKPAYHGQGYDGGDGVAVDNDVTINNRTGIIEGGNGGAAYSDGGAGGVGVSMYGNLSTLSNTDNGGFNGILGGNGGSSYIFGGSGGNGVTLFRDAATTNASVIAGGIGGYSEGAYKYGRGGDGGDGAYVYGSMTNTAKGRISGGAGGEAEGKDLRAGNGGTGALFSLFDTSKLTNDGLITGGAGGACEYNSIGGKLCTPGNGGDGVYFGRQATFNNAGTIIGGAVGSGGYGGQAGIGLVDRPSYECAAINSGVIIGGAGRDGSYLQLTSGGVGAELGGIVTLVNTGTIYGGAGGSEANRNFGLQGGDGVVISGGTLINAGRIGYGAPGEGGSAGTSDAVLFSAIYAATLEVLPGASFKGNVVANTTLADVLELGGHSTVALNGIGTQFTNFRVLSFATGAIWTIGGDVAGLGSLQQIDGFVVSDTIVIDGFTETNIPLFADGVVELGDTHNSTALDITFGTTLTHDMLITGSAGNTSLSMVATTSNVTLGAGTQEVVFAGGNATKMTVRSGAAMAVAAGGALTSSTIEGSVDVLSGGTASHVTVMSDAELSIEGGAVNTTIAAGGISYVLDAVASNTTLAGGFMELSTNATLKGGFEFTGTGGELTGPVDPISTIVISGFTIGDQIELQHAAASSGTVSVTSNGVVAISAGGETYKLKIAGAVKGSNNFTFSNDVLTETSASMAFQRPVCRAVPAAWFGPELVMAGGVQAIRAPVLAAVSASTPAAGWVTDELFRVPNGGIQTMVTLQS
jgi:hypothetical protein